MVDDDPEVLSLAVDILRTAGYTVLGTGDPRHALRLARTHAEPLHLLLTGVVMPLMSGLQLAAEVRAIRPEVKILLSVYIAVNPALGSLKSDGLGFRFRRNALVERHDDTGVTMRVVSRLPHLDHR